jgi:hypothetical protein
MVLQLRHDEPLTNFAFSFNLRHYIKYRRAVQTYVMIAVMAFLFLCFLYLLYMEWYGRVQWQWE